MTLATPAGQIAIAEDLLAKTIAQSDAFQDLTDAADETAALAHIYFNSLPEPLDGAAEYEWEQYESYLPFVLVTTAPAGFRLIRDGVMAYAQSGTLGFTIEAKIAESDAANDQERGRWWMNQIGEIAGEMIEKDSTAGYLTLNTMDLVDWSFGPPEDETVRGFALARASFVVTYGVSDQ
jgi:hypothetical protein